MSYYESHNLEDKELPFIYRESGIGPTNLMFGASNWHENIEIIYVFEGDGAVSNNGQSISLTKGDITVINANHLHALASGKYRMLYRYLIVDRAFCLANGIDTNVISFDMCIDDGRVRELLEELHAAYSQPTDVPYRTLSIRSAVLRLVLLLCKEHSTAAQQTERPERSLSYVKQAIDYIRASYDKNFSLEDVSAFVGVNKCYLSREFHKYTGYSFVAYVNLTRCKMAQQLLRDKQLKIYDVGVRCGFENRSYFIRCFQRYVGMRPSEYRAQVLKTSNIEK